MNDKCFAGIDEAGYGPLLGPLVVALTGFTASDAESSTSDLWARLDSAVSRIPTRDGRIAVCDSKRLFSRNRSKSPLAPLETTALAFVTWREDRTPRSIAELLATLDSRIEPPLYAEELSRLELPIEAEIAGIERAVERLRIAAERGGIRTPILEARVVTESEYNRECERLGSKSRLLFDANVDLLVRARTKSSLPLSVCCDRHGGRARYRDLLAAAFPFESVSSLGHTHGSSRYRVGAGDSRIELEYRIGGEDESLPTALASIVAKYLREAFMTAFNRHFARRTTSLTPTAGYWTDGLRFLEHAAAAGALTELERSSLVRRR